MASSGSRRRRKRVCELALALVACAGCLRATSALGAPPRPRRPRPAAPAPAPPPAAAPPAPAAAPPAPAAAPPVPAAAPPSAPLAADSSSASEGANPWRQLMMAPRLTGNLRAIGVDPTDARNLYVGTEEGTLAHSLDGGVTWEEIELSPFLLQSPTVAVTLDGDPNKQIDVFSGFHVLNGELYRPFAPHRRDSAGKGIITAAPPSFGLPPDFVKAERFGDPVKEPLLGAVAGADARPYEDVQRIKVCPGATFGLFVTTPSKLLGSPDGSTFVPLFIARDSAPIGDVACSPTNPNEVIVTTGDGTFRSTDGGTSFDPMGGRFGPTGSTEIAFGPLGENGKSQLYVATGRDLWTGDSSDPESMHTVSTGGDSNGNIKSIAPSPQAVWIATEGGVRVSRDMGTTWIPANELEGTSWEKVAVAGNGQVAALREDIAYESTDGGSVFRPLFRGESRRRLRQIVALPASPGASAGFLLLTNGELWTTSAPNQAAARNDKVSRWAEQRLKNMPSLTDTIERALAKAHISPAQIEELASALRTRAWLPGVHVGFTASSFNQVEQQRTTVATQSATLTAQARDVYEGSVQLIWELPDLVAPSYNFTPARNNLYDLRKRYSYVVEDAYVERRHVLSQFINGGLDTEQFLTLQARLEVLDIVLQEFTADQGVR